MKNKIILLISTAFLSQGVFASYHDAPTYQSIASRKAYATYKPGQYADLKKAQYLGTNKLFSEDAYENIAHALAIFSINPSGAQIELPQNWNDIVTSMKNYCPHNIYRFFNDPGNVFQGINTSSIEKGNKLVVTKNTDKNFTDYESYRHLMAALKSLAILYHHHTNERVQKALIPLKDTIERLQKLNIKDAKKAQNQWKKEKMRKFTSAEKKEYRTVEKAWDKIFKSVDKEYAKIMKPQKAKKQHGKKSH